MEHQGRKPRNAESRSAKAQIAKGGKGKGSLPGGSAAPGAEAVNTEQVVQSTEEAAAEQKMRRKPWASMIEQKIMWNYYIDRKFCFTQKKNPC